MSSQTVMEREHQPLYNIVIYGQANLQNSLLMGFIEQNPRFSCEIMDSINHLSQEEAARSLVLLDSETTDVNKAKGLLHELANQYHPAPFTAFLNVGQNSKFEQFIAWPEVKGIFYKNTSQQQLVKGIFALFAGEFWFSRQLLADYLEKTRPKMRKKNKASNLLTKREKQILELTATGATNTEIAEHLTVSMHTVKTHIYNLFKKIGVSNRIQAINWAKENLDIEMKEFID